MDVMKIYHLAETHAVKGDLQSALDAYRTIIENADSGKSCALELAAMAQIRVEKLLADAKDAEGAVNAREAAIDICAGLYSKRQLMNVKMYTDACLRQLKHLASEGCRAEARLMYNRLGVLAKDDSIILSKAACIMLEISGDRTNDVLLYTFEAVKNADRAVDLGVAQSKAVRAMVYMDCVETLIQQGEMQTARQLFGRMNEFKPAERIGLQHWFEEIRALLSEKKLKEGG